MRVISAHIYNSDHFQWDTGMRTSLCIGIATLLEMDDLGRWWVYECDSRGRVYANRDPIYGPAPIERCQRWAEVHCEKINV